jgi:hypothetical protein
VNMCTHILNPGTHPPSALTHHSGMERRA